LGEKEKLIEWLREGGSQPLFSQIAAQSLFQCQNCNECCRGEGYSLVDREDIKRIAISLGLDEAEATSRFTDPDPEGREGLLVLKTDPRSQELLRLRLFIWQQILLGWMDEVERTSSMMNISPPTLDGEFRRECLAYFLLTVSLEGLEDIDSQSESP